MKRTPLSLVLAATLASSAQAACPITMGSPRLRPAIWAPCAPPPAMKSWRRPWRSSCATLTSSKAWSPRSTTAALQVPQVPDAGAVPRPVRSDGGHGRPGHGVAAEPGPRGGACQWHPAQGDGPRSQPRARLRRRAPRVSGGGQLRVPRPDRRSRAEPGHRFRRPRRPRPQQRGALPHDHHHISDAANSHSRKSPRRRGKTPATPHLPGDWTVTDFAEYYDVNPLYQHGSPGRQHHRYRHPRRPHPERRLQLLGERRPEHPCRPHDHRQRGRRPGRAERRRRLGETTLDVEQAGGHRPGREHGRLPGPEHRQGFVDAFAAAIGRTWPTLSPPAGASGRSSCPAPGHRPRPPAHGR